MVYQRASSLSSFLNFEWHFLVSPDFEFSTQTGHVGSIYGPKMGCLKMGSSFIAVLKNNMPAMASGTSKMYMFIGNMLNYDYDDELLDFPSTLLPNKPIWLEINNLFKRSHQCLMNMAVDPGTDPW